VGSDLLYVLSFMALMQRPLVYLGPSVIKNPWQSSVRKGGEMGISVFGGYTIGASPGDRISLMTLVGECQLSILVLAGRRNGLVPRRLHCVSERKIVGGRRGNLVAPQILKNCDKKINRNESSLKREKHFKLQGGF